MWLSLDLDGVILDCKIRQTAVFADILRRLELPDIDLERWWTLKRRGQSSFSALSSLLSDDRDLTPQEVFDRIWLDTIESDDYLWLDAPLPGTKEALDLLSERSNLHLLTARQRRDGVEATLVRYGLSRFFDRVDVVSPFDVTARKAAILTEVSPHLFIGDTETDFQAASIAQVPVSLVLSGQRDSTFLGRLASPLADSLLDLATQLEPKS